MPSFIDHVDAEIQALERSLEDEPRFLKLRELYRIRRLYTSSVAPMNGVDLGHRPAPVEAPQRKPATRKVSPETEQVIAETEFFLQGNASPIPLRNLYHHVVNVRGCKIGGKDPVNGLSAMLSRSGRFVAHGRSGWTLRPRAPTAGDSETSEPKESDEAPDDNSKTNGASSFL